jgi:hypothetical protein
MTLRAARIAPHFPFPLGQALLKRRPGEVEVHVAPDRCSSTARKLDAEGGQAPEQRRQGRVDQRKLVAEEKALCGKHLGTGQQTFLQHLALLGCLLAVGGQRQLPGERQPVPLDAVEREPELCPGHRVDGHQRRVGKPFVEVLADDP